MYDDGAETVGIDSHAFNFSVNYCMPSTSFSDRASQRSLRFGVGLAPQPNHAIPARTCILSASWLLGKAGITIQFIKEGSLYAPLF